MLSFVPGHVPPRWQQFTDDQVGQAATQLRQLHDATRDLASIFEGEVVCHHDPGPNNTVWRGILDNEAASIPRARSQEVLAWTQRELAYIETNQETFIAVLNSA